MPVVIISAVGNWIWLDAGSICVTLNERACNINMINEPLGYQGTLDYVDEFPLLGIPVQFRSNHPQVIEHARSALGHWHSLAKPLCDDSSSLRVDIIIEDTDGAPVPAHYDFTYRVRGDSFLASQGSNLLSANRGTGKAVGFVNTELLHNEAAFSCLVLEALALFLLTATRRVAVHASAVSKQGRAIAFVGNSGAGKSSLAYACLKRGFDLLSEDTLFVGTEADYRIWGHASKVHLLPDAVKLFPELKERSFCLRPNGKVKIPVPIVDIHNCHSVLQTVSLTVCVLESNHHNRDSCLQPMTSDQVRKLILASLEPGFDLGAERLPEALARLLSQDTYRLSVGYDLNAMVDLIEDLLLKNSRH
jgi:hypothetical protein